MRSKLKRLRDLLARLRTDRRLPPDVLDLYQHGARLRVGNAAATVTANARAVLGAHSVGTPTDARLGSRRVDTCGDLDVSTAELGHQTARRVSDALRDASIGHFVTGRRGDGLSFGVDLSNRQAALAAIVAIDEPGWFVEWSDGRSTGLVALADAGSDQHCRRARSWVVFRAHRWGPRAVGLDEGAELTFWEPGSSGQFERIGARGQQRFDGRSPTTTEIIDGRPYPGNTAFPVAANFEDMADPIDIVYTWVDGARGDWLESFAATAAAQGRRLDEGALDPARYRSRDELRYSLRSVWAHCGWARTIWIVTAGQRPEWLSDDPRIRFVDHVDIFPPDALPTFNSHAIEASLHHIDGLAEHFVYFNDDMLVARPTRPELFFTGNGLAKVFQSDARPPGFEDDRTIAVDTGALRGRELLADRFGRVVSAKPYHSPYPLRRSVMDDMEREFTDIVTETRHSRFRSPRDLSTAASFAQHYGVATGRAVFADIATEYVHVESARLDRHLERILLGSDLDTFCINETGDVAGDHTDREQRIHEFFEAAFPIAAPWERADR